MAENNFIYVLPSLGADMDEAALLEWKIKPGDRVKRGQVGVTLETVKAAIDAEIWVDGVVEELLIQPDKDRKIKVGAPLARLKTDKPVESPAVVAAPVPSAQPAVVVNPTPPSRHPSPIRGGVGGGVQSTRILISPAARRRMEELGIAESALVPLDRPYGIADIEQFAASRQSSGSKTMRPSTPLGTGSEPPVTTMRGQIAKAMSGSRSRITRT